MVYYFFSEHKPPCIEQYCSDTSTTTTFFPPPPVYPSTTTESTITNNEPPFTITLEMMRTFFRLRYKTLQTLPFFGRGIAEEYKAEYLKRDPYIDLTNI